MKRFLYLIILCVILAGCKGTPQKQADSGKTSGKEKPAVTVTVTISPYKYFVDQIAKGKVDVNVMVSNGNNPETYEPYAQQMKVIDTSVGIKPAKTPGGNIDPHVWMSCSNARIIASNILKALCELEPKNKAFFEKNYQSLLSIIDKRDSTIKESFKKDPDLVRKFVIYHPILTYFARDYQLEQLAIEEEGREPSASQLKSLIQRARKENIKFCLIQAEFANRNTTTFINESHTKPMDINPLQGDWNWSMQEAAAAVLGKEIVVGK